jgi:sporulation protein YlmC with PRC-barrel domain
MMQETTTTTENLELGELESRDIITDDGRRIGVLKGILVDTTAWTVPQLVIEVNKKILDEIKIKKPMLSTVLVNVPTLPTNYLKDILDDLNLKKPGAVLVNVPTTHVKSTSDVVQLDTDLSAVSSVVTISHKK